MLIFLFDDRPLKTTRTMHDEWTNGTRRSSSGIVISCLGQVRDEYASRAEQ